MQFSTLDCMSQIYLECCAVCLLCRGAVANFMRNWTSTSCVIFTFHSHSHPHAQSSTANFCNSLNNFSCSFVPFSSSSRFSSLPLCLSLSVSALSVTCKCCCILHYCHDITACGIAFESYQTGAKNVVKQCGGRRREKKTSKEQEIWIRKLFHFFSFFCSSSNSSCCNTLIWLRNRKTYPVQEVW